MGKSLVASIPTGILLATAILVILGFVESYRQEAALKRAGSDRIYVRSVQWTPEGTLRYSGWQWDDQRGHVEWYYDETLTTPVRLPSDDNGLWWKFPTAWLWPIGPKVGEWTAGRIFLLATEDWTQKADVRRMLWWNGFEGRFEEYDAYSARQLASLGAEKEVVPAPAKPAGRIKPELVMEGGAHPAQTRHAFLVSNGNVQRVSLPLKSLDTVLTVPSGQPVAWIGRADQLSSDPSPRPSGTLLLIRYGDSFCLVHQTGKHITSFVLPAEARTGTVTVRLLKDDRLGFGVWPSQRDQLGRKPSVFLLVDSDGKVLRRVDVDIDAINRKLHGRSAPPAKLAAPSLLPPIPVLMTTPALVQATLLMLLAVILVVRHQKRTGQTGWRRVLWPVFVAVSSVFGFACYWVAHRDDVAEPCPGCGRRRPVNLAHCPHCGAAWPGWNPLGIEILEGLPSPGSA